MGKGGEEVFLFAARLRAALLDGGVMVLDRAVTPQVVIENQDANGGMRSEATHGDYGERTYLVQVRSANGTGRVEVVDVRSSRLVEARDATLGEGDKVAEVCAGSGPCWAPTRRRKSRSTCPRWRRGAGAVLSRAEAL